MQRAFLLVLILAFGFAISAAHAAPMPAVDVPALVEVSDVIVVGRAARVDRRPGAPETERIFTVAVDRVLKGSADPKRLLELRLNVAEPGYTAVEDRQFGMYFVKRIGVHVYEASDPFYPVLPASPTAQVGSSNEEEPLDRVAAELTTVLATPPSVLIDPLTGVQDLIVGEPAEQAQAIYYETASALQTIPYAFSADKLHALATSTQFSTRLSALRSLFATDKEAVDASLINKSLEYLTPILLDPPAELVPAVRDFANSLEADLNHSISASTLVQLLHSRDVAIRRAAASKLSETDTTAAIAALARTALEDEDQTVRYFAVFGLAQANGRGRAPSFDVFEEREAEFLSSWRAWARVNAPQE